MKAALIDFYRSRIAEHGISYEAQWGDASEWKSIVRFGPLALLPIQDGDVVVDIGCGTASLAAYLAAAGRRIRYVGIEAVPEFAEAARRKHGVEVLELDGFGERASLPEADWYLTFGTLNKEWSVQTLPGEYPREKIFGLLTDLFHKSRKGVAASFTTDIVEFRKEGVCNLDPGDILQHLRTLTPHFCVFHGYPMYEFFASAWRGKRLGAIGVQP